ncbi:MAG: alpha-glucan family phosphorylase [Thermofilaceae archaeon]
MEASKGGIVFVAMEIQLEGLPTYAGGLGLLAGDLLQSAADLGVPLIGVTLAYDRGYVWHEIVDGRVMDRDEPYEPASCCEKLDLRLRIDLKTGPIHLAVWRRTLRGAGGEVPVYLLDARVPENPPHLRGLTSRVYIEGSREERLLKMLCLGLGALQLVEMLGLNVRKFHLNESHAGFLAIELLKRGGDPGEAKRRVVFTTHTPLPHGHESFSYDLVEKHYDVPEMVKKLSPDKLVMTRVLAELAGYYNCVSRKFSLVHRLLFPGSNPDYITNGVHHVRWTHPAVASFYDKWAPGWRGEPGRLYRVLSAPLEEVVAVKQKCRKELAEYASSRGYVNRELDPRAFTIAARRRITGYKRLSLILRDRELLDQLGKRYGIQLVFSGTVHPDDQSGREELSRILDAISTLSHVRIAFIGWREASIEKLTAAGADLWLHVPRPPYEACGTSWMRAALNLTPTLASRDGGVLEALIDGHNGWLFGKDVLSPSEPLSDEEDARELYSKLLEILELRERSYRAYALVCARAAATIAPHFNSHRALCEYVSRAYA